MHAVGTWQHCRWELCDYAFFAAGVVGCSAWLDVRGEGRRRAPLRIEPHGIVEPFEWLLDKLHGRAGGARPSRSPQGKR